MHLSQDAEEMHMRFMADLPEAQRSSHMVKVMEHHRLIGEFHAATASSIRIVAPEALFAMLARAFFLSEGRRMGIVPGSLARLLQPWVTPLTASGQPNASMYPYLGYCIAEPWAPTVAGPADILRASAFGFVMWAQPPKESSVMYLSAIEVLGLSIRALEASAALQADLEAQLQTLQAGFGADEMMWVLLILHAELSRKHQLHTIPPQDLNPHQTIRLMTTGLIAPCLGVAKACKLKPQIPGGYIAAVILLKEAGTRVDKTHSFALKVCSPHCLLFMPFDPPKTPSSSYRSPFSSEINTAGSGSRPRAR